MKELGDGEDARIPDDFDGNAAAHLSGSILRCDGDAHKYRDAIEREECQTDEGAERDRVAVLLAGRAETVPSTPQQVGNAP